MNSNAACRAWSVTAAILMLLSLCLIGAPSARAQSSGQPPPASAAMPAKPTQASAGGQPRSLYVPGEVVYLGKECTRRRGGEVGIIKKDPCGRWGCFAKDINDVTDARHDSSAQVSAVFHCTWRLDAATKTQQCKCLGFGDQK